MDTSRLIGIGSHQPTSGGGGEHPLASANNVRLARVLNLMFPSAYLELYHQLRSPASDDGNRRLPLFRVKPSAVATTGSSGDEEQDSNSTSRRHQTQAPNLGEPSTEPSSRAKLLHLVRQFDLCLVRCGAKPVGLCPIRRSIYDQCFDELIRQVTVNCIERGLLLFRLRNELRMSLNYHRRAYESGVRFGLNKALEVELKLRDHEHQLLMEQTQQQQPLDCSLDRTNDPSGQSLVCGQQQELIALREELAKRDQIIVHQRSFIRALAQKYSDNIGPNTITRDSVD